MTSPSPTSGNGPAALHREAIVIGASAGGLEAVLELARNLPAKLPAAVFVVIHTAPAAPGFLPGLIHRAGPLPAGFAEDGAVALPGRIYLTPADHHLLIDPGGVMRVWRGPKENGFRPAIDPLFRSAARAYGPRAVGVILSGYLDDGTLGLMLLKRRGGVAVVQDPASAIVPEMPRAAIRNVDVDHVVPVQEMAELIVRLVSGPLPSPDPKGYAMTSADFRSGSEEGPIDTTVNPIERKVAKDGPATALTCPECGGAMWEQRVDSVLRYSCHLGHGYTGETLEDQYVRELEAALWTAMRHMVETADLHRRLAGRMRQSGPADRAADYEARARETERRVAVLRDLLVSDRLAGLIGRPGTPAQTEGQLHQPPDQPA